MALRTFTKCMAPIAAYLWLQGTVVPRLTTIIHSRKIAIQWKHRKTKLKTPLKHIDTRSMRSSGVKTHCPAKILHTAAIFTACIARNPSLNTAGSHFNYPAAILKSPINCLKKHPFAKNRFPKQGTDHRKAKKPYLDHRFAIAKMASWSGFVVMRGNRKAGHD